MKKLIINTAVLLTVVSMSACKVRTEGNYDANPPFLYEVTAVTTPSADATPNYTFSTDQAGIITYGGSCTSATTAATVGDNTITFSTLSDGTYSNCTITVSDLSSQSEPLAVTSFSVAASAGKIIFVTANAHSANFGGLAGADAFCMSEATSNVALNGKTFKAIMSDATNSAISRLAVHAPTVPLKLLDGTVVANGTAALWNTASVNLLAPIDRDQNNAQLFSGIWTGTNTDGTSAADNCNNWTSDNLSFDGKGGITSVVDFGYLSGFATGCDSNIKRVFCLEQ